MKVIEAIIEQGKSGFYSIYLPRIPGLYGSGMTEDEAKKDLMDSIEMAFEHVEDTGKWGDYAILKNSPEIEYKYDLSGFFKTYNFFDITALANSIDINASLMRRYKTGNTKAGETQKKKIEKGIHDIAKKLSVVKL